MSKAAAIGMAFPLLVGLASSAQPQSDYEEVLIQWGLSQAGRERDLNPEGKRVTEILVASEDIVAESDPYPQWFNWPHVKTRPHVIEREVLLREGDVYRQELVDETERNLRGLAIFAVVRAVPVKAAREGEVGLLVVTKDLWSIRMTTDFSTVGTLLKFLQIRPTEQNFLGRGQQVALDFILRLDSLSVGQQFSAPRLWGSHLSFSENAALVFNRHTGRLEGSTGNISFGQPLYSLSAKHAYSLTASWATRPVRIYRGASAWLLPYPSEANPQSQVPLAYRAREAGAQASYTRAYGQETKFHAFVGVGGYVHRYAALGDSGLDEAQRQWLSANHLPRSEDAAYLLLGARSFRAEYAKLQNLQTFALSEDYQMGHWLLAAARWADTAWGSDTRFVELGLAARYRWLLWGADFLSIEAAATARWMPDAASSPQAAVWVNRRAAVQVFNASPPLGPGRFVVRGLFDARWKDLDNTLMLLGGSNGLRGVESEAFSGDRFLLFNVEYRTRPLEFHTLHAGLVFFWDAGSAFYKRPQLAHTLGLGIRALFPQFNVMPIRIDVGYVLNGEPPPFWNRFSASFGQIDDWQPTFLMNPLE
jgi:hypothetical protein